MSAQAGEFYAYQAAQYDIEMPIILNGEPVNLIDPAVRLSIHVADSIDHEKLPRNIWAATRDQVANIGNHLIELSEVAYPDIDAILPTVDDVKHGTYPAIGFLRAFTPTQKKLKTGHLRKFTAEVMVADEIPEDILDNLTGAMTERERHVSEFMAYLKTTAELYSGRYIGTLGSISCIAVAGRGAPAGDAPYSQRLKWPVTDSRPITTSDNLAMSALRESRAIGGRIEAQGLMQRPRRKLL